MFCVIIYSWPLSNGGRGTRRRRFCMSPDTRTKSMSHKISRRIAGVILALAISVSALLAGASPAAAKVDPGDLPKITNTGYSALSITVYAGERCKGKATKVKPGRSKRGNSFKASNGGWMFWGKHSKRFNARECVTPRQSIRVEVSENL